nr:CopD family protein [Bacillus methanolicus]
MSIALYIGVIFFHLFIYRAEHQESSKVQSRSKKIIWLSLLGIAISLLINLPLQTSINANVTWSQAFTPSLLKETLNHTAFGLIWIVQMIIFGILVITTYFALKQGSLFSIKVWGASIIFIIGLLVTKSLTSHAAGSHHEIIPVAMDFLHLVAASVWIGILSAIVIFLPKSRPKTENGDQSSFYSMVIQRFSPWAIGAVIIILATGMYGSFMYVPTFYSLIHTSYGRVLLGKIILFFLMLLLGAFHLTQGKKRKRQKLGWTLGLELTVGVIVMVMAAILTNLPPATASPGPFDQTKRTVDNGYHVSLHISPDKEGVNVFKVELKDKSGRAPTNIEQVTLTFSSADVQAGESTMIVPNAAPGVFQTEGMHLNMAGRWNVRVHVLTKSLDSFDTDFRVVVGSH